MKIPLAKLAHVHGSHVSNPDHPCLIFDVKRDRPGGAIVFALHQADARRLMIDIRDALDGLGDAIAGCEEGSR